jgi:hypothetical protein
LAAPELLDVDSGKVALFILDLRDGRQMPVENARSSWRRRAMSF